MKLRGWALVTGGSAGIGLEVSRGLLRKGYSLILVSRSPQKLKNAKYELSRELQKSDERQITIHTADLAEPSAADNLYAWVQSRKFVVEMLVNDAGMYICDEALNVSRERVEAILSLNIRALTTLSLLFAREMAERGRGRIVNISSYSVYMRYAGLSLYGATKAYVRNFSVALSREVRSKGVKITTVAPSGVDTGLLGLPPSTARLARITGFMMGPARCGRIIVRAAMRGRRYIVPGWHNYLVIPFLGLLRPVMTKVMLKNTATEHAKL
ncbi:MAG: SDR family NAD(P)-dependent oxidoreductase [Bacteroidales bacterium]|nr:SDR family NAD(P)-dependent oxidoreductase [Bacteroidales bacterium]